ncbi:MAG: hypothetical protein ISS02_01330 [Candidatus Portnoybacteria bacterium]|nr:hypothetical protein [Candidatus Portnoybacteria bacterium]
MKKKYVKALFIFVAILVLGFVVYVSIWLWIFFNSSYLEKVEMFTLSYEECLANNEDDCEVVFLERMRWMAEDNVDKIIESILDNSENIAKRISSLEMLSAMIRPNKNEEMSKEESDFYYKIYLDKTNPNELKNKAYELLINNLSADQKIIKIQQQAIKNDNINPEQAARTINILAKAESNDSANFFIEALKRPGDFPRLNSSYALIDMKAGDKIPDLIEIAFNKTLDVSIRAIALSTIKGIAVNTKIDNNDLLIDKLKQLLDDDKYSIRVNASEILELITGEKYNIEQASEKEFNEYLSETYFENMSIQGIDY